MESLMIENTELKNKLTRYEKIINETEVEKKKLYKELDNANELLNAVKTKARTSIDWKFWQKLSQNIFGVFDM